jgi:glyoxylase-like metal-dependent hydrolase (beta-lactamase superfamily II)
MKNIDRNVYFSGLLPEAGDANSYFIKHPGKSGNWLINSPKFDNQLVDEIRSMGGISYIFATHRDVVSYASELAHIFNAKRIIHEGDIEAIPDAEIVIQGDIPQVIAEDPDFSIVPTPGHTEGSCVLFHKNIYLFSGDSLAIHGNSFHIESPAWTWQDHGTLIESVARLSTRQFSWVLPDHGQTFNFDKKEAASRIGTAVNQANSVTINIKEQIDALEIYIEQLIGFGQKVQLEKMQAKRDQLKALLKK